MLKNKKKWLYAGALSLALLLTGCSASSDEGEKDTSKKEDETQVEKEDFVYKQYEIDTANRLKQYSPTFDKEDYQELLFVFDYECPYCKEWVANVLPLIEDNVMTQGSMQLVLQPLGILGEKSKYMMNVDMGIEKYASSVYFEAQKRFFGDNDKSTFGTKEYVYTVLKELKVEEATIEEILAYADAPSTSSQAESLNTLYSREYGLTHFPFVYVDGVATYNSYSIIEMIELLNGDRKAGDTYVQPKEEQEAIEDLEESADEAK